MSSDQSTADQSYREDRITASEGDELSRVALARRTDVRPEILYFLKDDLSIEVRRALAENAATPRQADLLLAEDSEVAVREGLAGKVAQLLPDLDLDEKDRVQQMTIDLLERLARDQAIRVRQILSETLRDVVGAPPHVIRQLALDAEQIVAEPILTFSPVLTDDDLIEIIAASPNPGVAGLIASRSDVNTLVADAIIETDDISAIALLLANDNALIREEALEHLIARAKDIESWHLPLVKRQTLPEGAAIRLAHFVADSLVAMLIRRGDITEDEVEEIRTIVNRRIDEGTLDPDWEDANPGSAALVDIDDLAEGDMEKPDTAEQKVARLAEEGKLEAKTVEDALNAADEELALAALASLSGIIGDNLMKVVESERPDAIIALCHRAGLSTGSLVTAQRLLGGISRDHVLEPDGDAYPIGEAAMTAVLDEVLNA